MINDDKLIKDFFSKEELDLLYNIKITKTTTLREAYNKLVDYLEKKEKEEEKYMNILKKMQELLPIYPKFVYND